MQTIFRGGKREAIRICMGVTLVLTGLACLETSSRADDWRRRFNRFQPTVTRPADEVASKWKQPIQSRQEYYETERSVVDLTGRIQISDGSQGDDDAPGAPGSLQPTAPVQTAPAMGRRTPVRLPSMVPRAVLPTTYLQDGADDFDDDDEGFFDDDEEDEDNPSGTGMSPGGSGMGDDPRRFGQAPEDNRLQFLRTATVLLQPGEVSVDFGLTYRWFEFRNPALLFFEDDDDFDVTNVRQRARQLVVPLEVRYGLNRRVQLFANLPIGFSHLETAHDFDSNSTRNFGIGDFTAGVSYLLHEEDSYGMPDVITTFSFTAPTGPHPFESSPGLSSLGNGFWNISSSILAIKTYDPAVVFGGFGYTHEFDRRIQGQKIDPGQLFNYQFGMGFAINDYLTLSTIFQGAYQTRTRINRQYIPGSTNEPFSVRLALVHTKSRNYIIEPFIRFGLNSDAPDADFGFIITRNKL